MMQLDDRFLRIGESYRYGIQGNTPSNIEEVDGFANWFYVTHSSEVSSPLRFQHGIWWPASVERKGEKQAPLIFCNTTPHKRGSWENPWEDLIAPDEGFAIYYGDNRDPNCFDASSVRGNRAMLQAFRLQHSQNRADRLLAPPILLTTTRPGFKKFEGIGLITRAEIVMQRLPGKEVSFQNFRFELTIIRLDDEGDRVSMAWLNERRRPDGNLEQQLELAPKAWRDFVEKGISVAANIRRVLYRAEVAKPEDQVPAQGSELEVILNETLDYFEHRKHGFEFAAARIVERHFANQGLDYRTGWITQQSGDGGFDFVGRVDLDPVGVFPSSRQIILGQAKCEKNATNGKDLARLAARLSRGWLGTYVTTSYFSRSVQREVAQDKYPLLLIPGVRVASSIRDDLLLNQMTLTDYLGSLEERYRVSTTASNNFSVLMKF